MEASRQQNDIAYARRGNKINSGVRYHGGASIKRNGDISAAAAYGQARDALACGVISMAASRSMKSGQHQQTASEAWRLAKNKRSIAQYHGIASISSGIISENNGKISDARIMAVSAAKWHM